MEKTIQLKNEYNSLDKLENFLRNASDFECSKEYDSWEMRTDANGQMEQCLLLKKSGMHAIKTFFIDDNTVKINYVIPNKVMHAYFGKSEKAYRNIIEIVAGSIKQAILAGSQKKAFDELVVDINKAAL